MISKHPDETTLVEYVSGAMSTAPCISVTTHLKFCDQCSSTVEALGFLGGDLLESLEKEEVSEELFDKMMECIDKETHPTKLKEPARTIDPVASGLPEFVRNLLPAEELQWKNLTNTLEVAGISVGEEHYELSLHRISAGGKAPEHKHSGTEITVVLRGSFSDEDGVYQPGDFLVRNEGDIHRPYAARNEECVCLSVLEAPIKLTGIKKVLNPFLSFSPS